VKDHKTPLRLTKEQNFLLETAAEACNKSKQAFIEEAVLARIDEVIERKDRFERVKGKPAEQSNATPQIAPLHAPATGFSDAINSLVRTQHPTVAVENAPVTPTQAPVVVQVGNSAQQSDARGSVGANMIDHMASWIVAGKDFEQTQRLRQAVAMLAHNASSAEERNTLAARLDEAIASKKAQPQPSLVDKGRIAFNKLMHFISE